MPPNNGGGVRVGQSPCPRLGLLLPGASVGAASHTQGPPKQESVEASSLPEGRGEHHLLPAQPLVEAQVQGQS